MGATQSFQSAEVSVYQYNMLYGKPSDNFKNAKLPSSQIKKPYRVKGTCVCLNPDGTPNKEAFQYNGGCYKCSSKRDVFYARGDITNDSWGASKLNQVPINLTSVGYTQYGTLDEAKQACESVTSCGAVLEDFDYSSGYAKYTLATGIQGAGSGVTTGKTGWELTRGDTQYSFGGSISGSTLTIAESAPTFPGFPLLLTGIGVADNTQITGSYGNSYTITPAQSVALTNMKAMKISTFDKGPITIRGQAASSLPIPRAFAEDYVSPTTLSRPTLTSPASPASGGILSDAINYLANAVSVSSAFDIVAQGIENPNTYYIMDGTSRKLRGDPVPTDFGICVGPCDPQHPIHDPIQLVYEPLSSQRLFTLTGTTCSDSTKNTIDQPSIPATYIQQEGEDCDNSAASGYGGSQTNLPVYSKVNQAGSSICRAECPYGTIDNEDGTCTKTTIPRPSVQPSYSSCPPGYTKVDSLCVAPCDPGFMLDGEYCVPTTTSGLTSLSNAGSNRINCTAQPFTTTSVSVSGSRSTSGSSTATKWLCDTQADVDALLAGPSTTSGTFRTYTTPNDTICLADDPTTGMYFCQTIQEAKDATPNYISWGMYETCDNLVKAYYDLSNNLTILAQASLNARNTNEQLRNIQISLQNSINAMCPASSSTSGSSTCNLLLSQLSDLQRSIATGGSRVNTILNPVSLAIESRTQLVAQMDKFQCEY
jgi:hypothetical protein